MSINIRQIATAPYDFTQWKRLLDIAFREARYEDRAVPVADPTGKAAYTHRMGDITLADGNSLIVLEAEVKKEHFFSKSALGFRHLIGQGNLLIFYFSENKVRLSLVCKGKRFTFHLGAGERCITFSKRWTALAAKKNPILEDVLEVFSVQRLKAEFLKDHASTDQYDFTTEENTPDDQTVAIDPEMLGRIFENRLDDGKGKGAYYTPKEVVHYMCRESIIHYLEGKLRDDSIAAFIRHQTPSEFILKNITSVVYSLKAVKIFDPAVGSGAFPLGMLHVISTAFFHLHELQNTRAPFDAVNIKMDIIRHSLYGCDIEKGAIDIARLRLALVAGAHTTDNLIHGNALQPDNTGQFDIVIGNPPYIKEYTRKSAFDGLRESPYYRGKMDVWQLFACHGLDRLSQGGIQCFIAQNNWTTSTGAATFRDKVLRETEIVSYTDFGNHKVFPRAGIQTMIYVLRKQTPREEYKVSYARLAGNDIGAFLNGARQTLDFDPAKYVDRYITFTTPDTDALLDKISRAATEKLKPTEVAQGIVPNPDVVNTKNIKRISGNGIHIGDGVFVVDMGRFDHLAATERKYIKPLLEPSQIDRYRFVDKYEKEIIYITKGNYRGDAPQLLDHLSKYKPIMEERRENQQGRLEYFHLHWPRDSYFFEAGPKILSVRKCARPTFVYTEEPAYVMMAFNVIRTERINLKYLTALLNSRLVAYWLQHRGKLQGNLYQVDKEPLLDIPIAVTDKTHVFETLVDYIAFAYRSRQTKLLQFVGTFEKLIDHGIFEVYFPEHGVHILDQLADLSPIGDMDESGKLKTVTGFYHWLNEQSWMTSPARATSPFC